MKNNQKCVRMSDEVLEYVNRFPGEGFNQKFENMVLYFKKSEPGLKKRLDALNREIQNRQAAIRALDGKISGLQGIERGLEMIKSDISSLHTRAKHIASL